MGGDSKMKSHDTLSSRQLPVSSQMGGYLARNAFSPLQMYQGPMVAELIPEMRGAREILGRYQPGQFDDLSQKALEDALSGEPSFDVSPEATAKYFGKGVAQPMMRSFDQNIKPRINEAFAAQGAMFNTRRSESQVKALQNAQQDLSAELARAQMNSMALEAQLAESAAMRQQQAMGLAEAFEDKPLRQSKNAQGAAAGFQTQEQAKTEADYKEWLRTRPEHSPWPQLALGYLSNPEIALQQESGGGMGGSIGSLAGAGLGALAGTFLLPGVGTAAGAALGSQLGGGIGTMMDGNQQQGTAMFQRAGMMAPYLPYSGGGDSGQTGGAQGTPLPADFFTERPIYGDSNSFLQDELLRRGAQSGSLWGL